MHIGDAAQESFRLGRRIFGNRVVYSPYIAQRCNNLPVISGWVVSWNVARANPLARLRDTRASRKINSLEAHGRTYMYIRAVLIGRNLTLRARDTHGSPPALANNRLERDYEWNENSRNLAKTECSVSRNGVRKRFSVLFYVYVPLGDLWNTFCGCFCTNLPTITRAIQ